MGSIQPASVNFYKLQAKSQPSFGQNYAVKENPPDSLELNTKKKSSHHKSLVRGLFFGTGLIVATGVGVYFFGAKIGSKTAKGVTDGIKSKESKEAVSEIIDTSINKLLKKAKAPDAKETLAQTAKNATAGAVEELKSTQTQEALAQTVKNATAGAVEELKSTQTQDALAQTVKNATAGAVEELKSSQTQEILNKTAHDAGKAAVAGAIQELKDTALYPFKATANVASSMARTTFDYCLAPFKAGHKFLSSRRGITAEDLKHLFNLKYFN